MRYDKLHKEKHNMNNKKTTQDKALELCQTISNKIKEKIDLSTDEVSLNKTLQCLGGLDFMIHYLDMPNNGDDYGAYFIGLGDAIRVYNLSLGAEALELGTEDKNLVRKYNLIK